jgi:hypothetical protein
LAEVLHRLSTHNLKIKPDKCRFFQPEISVLGFIVNRNGVATDPNTIQSVHPWHRPENLKQLKAFLGSCSYYRTFLSQFSIVAEPLYALTRKDVRFRWTDKAEAAFQLLKHKLTTAPVLALPCDDADLILDVDASDSGLGAGLSMLINGIEKSIAYASRTYTPTESRYCITRKELTGLIFGLQKFRQFLLSKPFTIRTDHAPLITLQKNPNPSSQMLRWIDLLQEFEFKIIHRPGNRHQNADGLLRSQPLSQQCNVTEEEYKAADTSEKIQDLHPMEDTVPSKYVRHIRQRHHNSAQLPDDIAKLQAEDPDIAPIYAAMQQSVQQPEMEDFTGSSDVTKTYLAQWPMLTMNNNVLYRRWIHGHRNTKWLQCIIPHCLVLTDMLALQEDITDACWLYRRTLCH